MPDRCLTVKLGDVCNVVTGATPAKNNPNYYGGDIPWIKPDDLNRGMYVISSSDYLSKEGAAESRLLPSGSVLVSCIGNIGKIAIAGRELATNQQINALIPSKLIESEYLYFAIQVLRSELEDLASVSVVPIINKSTFSNVEIPLPPISEQRRIVEILRQADDLRRLRREANAKAAQLLPALFYKMFGDPATNPKGWEVSPFSKFISSTQYGLSTSLQEEGDVGVVRMNNITQSGNLDFVEMKYLSQNQVDFNMYDLRLGDILFNRTNSKELVGKTGLWEETKQMYTFASYIIRVRLKSSVVPEYIWALLNSAYGKNQVFRLGKQAVNMANINTQELGTIPIPLPPKDLQQDFATVVGSIKKQLQANNTVQNTVETLFQSLLARAFSGELTTQWREVHREQLEQEAYERDAALGLNEQIGVVPVDMGLVVSQEANALDIITLKLEARATAGRELGITQLKVLAAIVETAGYFTSESLSKNSDGKLAEIDIRRSLPLLEAAGLVRRVNLLDNSAGFGIYVDAYRAVNLDKDEMRLADLAVLEGAKA